MLFWKRTFPLLMTFILGTLAALQYYVPHPASEGFLTGVVKWQRIILGFAMILGVASLSHLHYVKIRRKEAGWGYSLVVHVAMIGTVLAGVLPGLIKHGSLLTEHDVFTAWIYGNILVALQGTMFSILAFFVASAAYRAFRARTKESTILLLAAAIVMFGRVPLGEYLVSGIGKLSDWILNVLNTAARRAILIGISLGSIATSIKIIFGIERAYLGGRE